MSEEEHFMLVRSFKPVLSCELTSIYFFYSFQSSPENHTAYVRVETEIQNP